MSKIASHTGRGFIQFPSTGKAPSAFIEWCIISGCTVSFFHMDYNEHIFVIRLCEPEVIINMCVDHINSKL